jgi:periplasmic protein TonB
VINTSKKLNHLKQNHRKALESSLMLSLIIVAFLFYSFKSFDNKYKLPSAPSIDFEIEFIEPTKPDPPKPPPSKPPIPVEAEIDELAPDIPIDFFEEGPLASFGNPPPPPPIDEPDVYEFVHVQEKPVLLKQISPYYPELARKAQIEGTVVVKVLIDTKGNVERTELLKSIPMLDEAALQAAKKCIFKPAKQRDKFVKVWMSIPFKFKLN